MRSSRFLPLALLTTALTLACGDSTGPGTDGVVGRYVLQAIDGQPLPILTASFPVMLTGGGTGTQVVYIVADTTRLDGRGHMRQVRVHRSVVRASPTDSTVTVGADTTSWGYTLAGDSIFLSFQCPPDADCAPPPRGRVDSSWLELRLGLSDIVERYVRLED